MQDDCINSLFSKNSHLYFIDVFATRLTVSFVDRLQRSIFNNNFTDDVLLATFKQMTDHQFFTEPNVYNMADNKSARDLFSMTLLNDRFNRAIRSAMISSIDVQKKLNHLLSSTMATSIVSMINKIMVTDINLFRHKFPDDLALDILIGIYNYKNNQQYDDIKLRPINLNGITNDRDENTRLDDLFVLIESEGPVYNVETIPQYHREIPTIVNMANLWPVTCGNGLFSQPLYTCKAYPEHLKKRIRKAVDKEKAIHINARIIVKGHEGLSMISLLMMKLTAYANNLAMIEKKKYDDENKRRNEVVSEKVKKLMSLCNK